jgi:hypothetical protein
VSRTLLEEHERAELRFAIALLLVGLERAQGREVHEHPAEWIGAGLVTASFFSIQHIGLLGGLTLVCGFVMTTFALRQMRVKRRYDDGLDRALVLAYGRKGARDHLLQALPEPDRMDRRAAKQRRMIEALLERVDQSKELP